MPEKPDRQPNPDLQNEVFVKEVRRMLFGVKYTEEKPTLKPASKGPINQEDAGTVYTFTYDEKTAVAEWRSRQGFYVTPTREKNFGKDATSVIMNPYLAANRVVKLLGSGDLIGLAE